jgi:cobalt/nickel transport system permease protein
MHMADVLISPQLGGAFWAASAGLIAFSARKLRQTTNDRLIPMMGVLGAFIFAAQTLNFAIPGTGSSGHLGGGMILAILLGPYAAFLVIASVLSVQALVFADGGLLALGCNIFNLGFFPTFIAYPLLYRPIAGSVAGGWRVWAGSILASAAGLLLGAFCVVLQTTASGMTSLPFGAFASLMLPIHLAIGIVEGVATAFVVSFVAAARPDILREGVAAANGRSIRSVALCFLVAALLIGGIAYWFASTRPDGLEWAIVKVAGSKQPAAASGTSVSGVIGGVITLLLACAAGFLLRRRFRPV